MFALSARHQQPILPLRHCNFLKGKTVLEGITKVLLYAPGDSQGLELMRGILKSIDIQESNSSTSSQGWDLLPMRATEMRSSSLGDILIDALVRVRELSNDGGSVIFLGMDAPELPLGDIAHALRVPNEGNQSKAILCPADDGGYGMLSVPTQTDPVNTFSGVLWSHPLTAVSQMKALTDQNITCHVGQLMYDIDEPSDLDKLAERLANSHPTSDPSSGTAKSVLQQGVQSGMSNHEINSEHQTGYYTSKALQQLGDNV